MLSAIQNMQSMIRPQGTMPVDLTQSRATIWEPLLCRSRYDADALDAQIAAAQQQGETEYQAAQQQEDSQYQQQYQEPQYQESGYTEEQEQQFNEFGSRVWEDAKESISESFSEGLDGFWSPETIAQGLELGKNLLLE